MHQYTQRLYSGERRLGQFWKGLLFRIGRMRSDRDLSNTSPSRSDQIVAMVIPGGLDNAGGIGRWAGYLQASWDRQHLQPPLELIDSRASGHPGRAAMAFVSGLRRILALHRAGRLGTVHANLSKRGSTIRKFAITTLARAFGIPVVLHLHGSGYDQWFAGLRPFWQRRITEMFGRADRVVVLGRSWAEWVEQEMQIGHDRVTVLHNGVARPERQTREDGPCRILLLGRLGPRKGVPELIAALDGAALRQRAWTATLAGDGEIVRYRQEVAAAGLADRIALPGWLGTADTAALLAQADILVLPSHAENFPISIIEALAAEVAVVATPIGTTPELLQHERSALFVPVGDVDALAAALLRLIDDPALRRRIAAAGHAVFERELDIDVLARQLAELHASLGPAPAC